MGWARNPAQAVSACSAAILRIKLCNSFCFKGAGKSASLAVAHTARGSAHAARGDLAKALADLDAALAFDRGYARARTNRAAVLAMQAGPQAVPPAVVAEARPELAPPAVRTTAAPDAAPRTADKAMEPAPAQAQRPLARAADPPESPAETARRAEAERKAAAERQRDAALAAEAAEKAAEAAAKAAEERERERVLVRRLQLALGTLGFAVGPADGVKGARTEAALAAYMADAGLPRPSSTLGEALVAGIEADASALRQRRLAEAAAAAPPAPPPTAEAVPPAPASPPATAEAAPPPVVEPVAPAPGEAVVATAEKVAPQPAPAAVREGSRVALVIGNSAYTDEAVPALVNPAHDAADMAAALRKVGFKVFEGYDLGRLAMEDLNVAFAKAAQEADFALIFYSGHGLQVGTRNYLIPIDAKVKDEYDLRRLIAADDLVEDASRAKEIAIVMLDACRDNPLSRSLARGLTRSSVGRGLARPSNIPAQTLIAYATAEGAVAADGTGRNSPFTAALLQHLPEPGLEVRLLFGKVRDAVVAATGGEQRPNIYSDLGGEPIYLVPGA
jgi:peptidoglycan hydrolase-like protein with peptidoglycan-binding domain